MIGFLASILSSLSMIVIMFAAILVVYMDMTVPGKTLIKLDETTYRFPLNTVYISEMIRDEIQQISRYIAVEDKQGEPDKLKVGCHAGFDISSNTALNIMIYNTIKLNTFELPARVMMHSKPSNQSDKHNYCYIDFERSL